MNSAKKMSYFQVPGSLISMPLSAKVSLDGFWCHAHGIRKKLLVFVHGMRSNFYKSRFKKEIMKQAERNGFDVLMFNNRGNGTNVETERFTNCLKDIHTALQFGRTRGYRHFFLMGHSTGCQKITYYQAVRRDSAVRALVLAAPADDYAICQRDLGRKYKYWITKARRLVAERKQDTRLSRCKGFSARRFLSVADPGQTEAKIFNYAGSLAFFRRIRCPVLAFFGSKEEYACMPVDKMGSILRTKTQAHKFDYFNVNGADHGFHGYEKETVSKIYRWLSEL